jgi:hypothetical protein
MLSSFGSTTNVRPASAAASGDVDAPVGVGSLRPASRAASAAAATGSVG